VVQDHRNLIVPLPRLITQDDCCRSKYGMEAASRGATVMAAWTEGGSYVLVKSSTSSPSQSRSSSHTNKVHRIDEHLWLFTAGPFGRCKRFGIELEIVLSATPTIVRGEASTVEQAARHLASPTAPIGRAEPAFGMHCDCGRYGSHLGSVSKSRVFRSDRVDFGGLSLQCGWQDHEKLMMGWRKDIMGCPSPRQRTGYRQ
jgi:hypothetical protein